MIGASHVGKASAMPAAPKHWQQRVRELPDPALGQQDSIEAADKQVAVGVASGARSRAFTSDGFRGGADWHDACFDQGMRILILLLLIANHSVALAERRASAARSADGETASAPPRVSIDDVIAVMVRQSPVLRRGRWLRSAADADVVAAAAELEWVLSAQFGGRQQAIDRPNPEPVQLLENRSITAQAGLSKRLATGAALSLRADLTRSSQRFAVTSVAEDGQSESSSSEARNSEARTTISITQPILRGAGVAVAHEAVQRARAQRDSTWFAMRAAAEDVLRDALIEYWELAFSAQAVTIAEQTVSLGHKQFEQTRESMRAGLVAASAVKAVQYQLAVREEALLRARLEQRSQSMALRQRLALDVEYDRELIVPAERFEVDTRPFDLDPLLERSLERNAERAQLLAEKSLADLEVAAARDRSKLQLDITVDAALVGNGDQMGDALGAIGTTYEVGATLVFSHQLGGARAAAIGGAQRRRSAAALSVAEAAYRVRSQVFTAYDAVMAARQRVTLAAKAIALAHETLEVEQANFAAGRSSTQLVLDRQSEIAESELLHARAVADSYQAAVRLEAVTGVLLERYGIDLVTSP